MAKKQFGGGDRREPSLKDQIHESGETPLDAVRAALNDEQIDHKFLGREFLTWLIYHADDENGGGGFTQAEGQKKVQATKDEFRVQLGGRVVLKALGEGAGEITAKGAAPAQTADVRYAIAGGLTVREADLLLLRGDRTWQLTVTAELFDVKRAKLPALLSEEDVQRAQERLELLDEMDAMLQAAYSGFLQERLRPIWERETVPLLRAWLARSILEKKQLALEMEDHAPTARGPIARTADHAARPQHPTGPNDKAGPNEKNNADDPTEQALPEDKALRPLKRGDRTQVN